MHAGQQQRQQGVDGEMETVVSTELSLLADLIAVTAGSAEEHDTLGGKLGTGAFGVVRRGVRCSDGEVHSHLLSALDFLTYIRMQ
jgi:hypothetical protein